MKHYAEYAEALQALEDAIVEQFGPEILEEWKVEQDDFKRKVVDPAEHKNLKNPYDVDALCKSDFLFE